MHTRRQVQQKIDRFIIIAVALSLGAAAGFIGGLIVGSLQTLKILGG